MYKQNWDKKTNIKPAIIATDDVPEIIMAIAECKRSNTFCTN